MRQPRPAPEHETLSEQQKAESNCADINQNRERVQQAGDALPESQASLSEIVHSARDAIVTVDNEQGILVFNCAWDQLLTQPIEIPLPQSVRAHHLTHRDSFIANSMFAVVSYLNLVRLHPQRKGMRW